MRLDLSEGALMAAFTAAEVEYLTGQRLGRLATAGADGKPHAGIPANRP